MGHVRLDKTGIERRRQQIHAWETQIERWDALKKEADLPGAKLLKASIEAAKKAAEREILDRAQSPTADATEDRNVNLAAGGKLLLAEMILGDMSPSEAKYEFARQKIAELKYEIEQAATHSGLIATKEIA